MAELRNGRKNYICILHGHSLSMCRKLFEKYGCNSFLINLLSDKRVIQSPRIPRHVFDCLKRPFLCPSFPFLWTATSMPMTASGHYKLLAPRPYDYSEGGIKDGTERCIHSSALVTTQGGFFTVEI